MNTFDLKIAQNEGMKIAKKYGDGSLPIDLFAIAQQNKIDIRSWFDGSKAIALKEEMQGLGSYEKTLTNRP